jgi:cytidine deaminase
MSQITFLDTALLENLLAAARQARNAAYAPYSHFPVGAAVLTADGRIFTGCNIENASFGATMCAERVAIFAAVAEGQRQIKALAVIADTPQPVAPCGLCSQVLMEFSPDCQVIMANLQGEYQVLTTEQLLPFAFEFPRPGGGDRDALLKKR